MKKHIGCDAHARYSIFASLREAGQWELEMGRFLKQLPAGSPVAIETPRNRYWLVKGVIRFVLTRKAENISRVLPSEKVRMEKDARVAEVSKK